MAGASAMVSDEGFPQGMRHNDDRLHETLSLAKACLKTGRCPGDLRQKDFFERFETQAQEVREAKQAAMPVVQPSPPPTPPPLPRTPEGISPQARRQKIRRDVRDLSDFTAKKREELDSVEKEYNKELLLRCRACDELRDEKADLRKSQRELTEMKDMIRLQEKEIETLKMDIDISSSKAAAALRAFEMYRERRQRQPQWQQQHAAPLSPVAGTGASVAKSHDSCLFIGESHDESTQEVSIEELRSVLLPEKKPPDAEPQLWSRLQTENEKLVSVIDQIGELGRQIRTPASRERIPDGSGAHTAANGGVGSWSAAASTFPPAPKVPGGLASILGYADPPKSRPAYASVLAKRPKQHKLYMN